MPRPRHLYSIVLSALALGGALAPLAAQDLLQSRDGVVRLEMVSGSIRAVDERGYSTPLSVPEGVVVEDIAALTPGWMLAGHEPRGDHRELYLRRLDAGGLRTYPVPRRTRGRHQTSPTLLIRDGQLAGLVWLEGDDRENYGVMASRWLGITWSEPTSVDPPGQGARLALDAAILEDGSWLLVWAGWDGEDDEIFVSDVVGGVATPPRPLTANAVPDLLPTVIGTAEGALVAWNTFDGDGYRVVTQRRVEGRWIDGVELPTGTYYPYLVRDEEVTHLLCFERRSAAAGWTVAELDAEGKISRRGRVASDDNHRPLLERTGEAVALTLPADGSSRQVVWETPQ